LELLTTPIFKSFWGIYPTPKCGRPSCRPPKGKSLYEIA